MPDESPCDHLQRGALFSPLLEAAVRLAARGHYQQFRKQGINEQEGSVPSRPLPPGWIPYITHIMGTMCILSRLDVRDEVLAAAILHDYLEDVPDPNGRELIREAVGEEVLSLVLEVTEHKRRDQDQTLTWEVRKKEQLEHMERMPQEAVMIKAADMLHNLQSLVTDLEDSGDRDEVWHRFNAGSESQNWYFTSVVEAVRSRLGEHQLVTDLEAAIASVGPYV